MIRWVLAYRGGAFALSLMWLGLVSYPSCHAQEYNLDAGPDLFQAWLKLHGIEPLTLNEVYTPGFSPRNSILVVWEHLDNEGPAHGIELARRFLEGGGAVLIATHDRGDLSGVFGDQVLIRLGHGLRQPESPGLHITVNPRLSAPYNTLRVDRPLRAWQPRRLEWQPSPAFALEQVARFEERNWPFAVALAGPDQSPYRFLLLADSSVLSNSMLVNEPGNYQFARNVVRYLQEPSMRSKCLFLEQGRAVEQFAIDFDDPPPPPPAPLPMPNWDRLQRAVADSVNRWLTRWEQHDAVNRALLGRDPEQQRRRLKEWLQVLGSLASVAMIVGLLRHAWRQRGKTESAPPRAVSDPSTAKGPYLLRAERMHQQEDYGELARIAARGFFHRLGISEAKADDLPRIEYLEPQDARSYAGPIADLWRWAYGPPRSALRLSGWREFTSLLDSVQSAAERGRWRFAPRSASS